VDPYHVEAEEDEEAYADWDPEIEPGPELDAPGDAVAVAEDEGIEKQ
jgi:hypothetical protein